MTNFTGADDLHGATFVDTDLGEARFVRASLAGAVMRTVDVDGADIDAPWLLEGGSLLVNGVDVAPLVDAELNRRFPGRELRRAEDVAGLRTAWTSLQQTWTETLARVDAMPAGTADVSVDGEWSFAQTLRHLVMATDTWLRRAVLGVDQPYHPIGVPHAEYLTDGCDPTVFWATDPARAETGEPEPDFDDVLAVRAERVAMFGDYLATVTDDELATTRPNPWGPSYQETVGACLRTILEEEWEHHRYAVRDLDAIAQRE